jgi:hypothetical protein
MSMPGKILLLAVTVCFVPATGVLAADDPAAQVPFEELERQGWTVIELKYRSAFKGLKFILPLRAPTAETQTLKITLGGKELVMEPGPNNTLLVDANGDGRTDTKISGLGKVVQLVYRDQQGKRQTYAVHFYRERPSVPDWKAEPACYVQGSHEKSSIVLIDYNLNSCYNDKHDLLVVGPTLYTMPLSKIVNLRGKLYHLRVLSDGTRAALKPYQGPTGRIDALSKFFAPGRLTCAIFYSEEGNYFNCVQVDEHRSTLVPSATYLLHYGEVKQGKQAARIEQGRMEPIRVSTGETEIVKWGAPIRLEFNYRREGGRVRVSYNSIQALGTANEQYTHFQRRGLDPKIYIRRGGPNAARGKPLKTGRFPSC